MCIPKVYDFVLHSLFLWRGSGMGFYSLFQLMYFISLFLSSNLFAEETSLIFYISFHPDLILSGILVHGDWI